jgi:hypothetical protein
MHIRILTFTPLSANLDRLKYGSSHVNVFIIHKYTHTYTHTYIRSLVGEIWTVTALCSLSFIFCILSPVLAMGWVFLPITHGMWHFTAFVIIYTITQNLPAFYSRKYKVRHFL